MTTESSIDRESVVRLEDGRLQIRAHAKLNLGLRVFPARPDGFHDLETWMTRISWYDTITVQEAKGLHFAVTGRTENIPTEHDKNLVTRAALMLASAAGIQPSARITLHKVLPSGGGIGGGSSDAACTLVALNQLWNLHLEPSRLKAIAAQLGSDIPFFVEGIPSLCKGRGEIMTPLRAAHGLFAVLLLPPIGCATKGVYYAFDHGYQHKPAFPPTDWQSCAKATVSELDRLLINDLEPAAFSVAPALATLRQRAAGLAKKPVHLTGSGSTLFILCGSGTQASLTAEELSCHLAPECACIPVRILA